MALSMLVFASGESREEEPGTRVSAQLRMRRTSGDAAKANTTGSLSFRANLTRSQEQAT